MGFLICTPPTLFKLTLIPYIYICHKIMDTLFVSSICRFTTLTFNNILLGVSQYLDFSNKLKLKYNHTSIVEVTTPRLIFLKLISSLADLFVNTETSLVDSKMLLVAVVAYTYIVPSLFYLQHTC